MKKRKACKLHFYSLHAFLFYNYCLQSCSESCAWQWGGEVIVLLYNTTVLYGAQMTVA